MYTDKIQRKARTAQPGAENCKSCLPPAFQLKSSPVQKKEAPESGSGGSKGMPEDVRGKMEHSFNADFSDVNIHANSGKASEVGALAYTQGNDIHFAPGQFKPESQSGQELLGHELTHVVQQREGRVNPTGQVGGMALNDDRSLESEADQMGRKAAEGQANAAPSQMKKSSSASGDGPVQCFRMESNHAKQYPKLDAFIRSEMPGTVNDARLAKYLEHYGTNQGDTARDITKDVQYGQGPAITPWTMSRSDVSFRSNEGSEVLRLNRADIEAFEKATGPQVALHERVIEANILNGYTQFLDDQDGKDFRGREGDRFEKDTYGKDIHSLWEARQSSRARFGQGNWEVTVADADPGMTQRVKVWNTADANGNYAAQKGTSISVSSRPLNKWSLLIESNEGDMNAKKGWKRSEMVTTQDGKDCFTVRSESDGDQDRNDVVLKVKKKG